jgi:hypothetical protein
MFFEEVKRTEGSHDEKNRRRSPPFSLAAARHCHKLRRDQATGSISRSLFIE